MDNYYGVKVRERNGEKGGKTTCICAACMRLCVRVGAFQIVWLRKNEREQTEEHGNTE